MLYNGRDLTSDGWYTIAVSQWLDGPKIQRASVPIPGVAGVIPATRAMVGERALNCTVRAYPSTLADRATLLRTLQDRIYSGLLAVRTDDWTDRIVRCVAGPLTVVPAVPTAVFASAVIDASFTLSAYDGASYDAEPRVLVLSTSPTALALGTLPSHGIIQLTGAWSAGVSRTLTLRNAGGVAVATLVLTAPTGKSLTSSEFLELDCTRRYITHVTSAGVRTNAYAWKSGGTWFALDPAHADRANGRDATFETSAGVGVFFYRRAYAL